MSERIPFPRRPAPPDRASAFARKSGSPLDILLIFLRLGCFCFGGPISHLGYFRTEFVTRRKWLTEQAYADLVALSQFLPGPASSQVGFGVGLMRGGLPGGLSAWIGFTAPSAALMVFVAYGASGVADAPLGAGLLHGLKLVAVAVVAQAVMGMAKSLCPDRERAAIATCALIVMLLAPSSLFQIGVILAGGLAGLLLRPGARRAAGEGFAAFVSRRLGLICLVAYFALLALAFMPLPPGPLALFGAFYRSGALVFGGGHVALPLLREAVVAPGWVSDGAFLAGYGAAQAAPGPLFAFAAYLGALAGVGPGGIAGAAIALAAIFLPGFLALLGVLPFWRALSARPAAQAAISGANAAVVGLLGAALYDPVWTSAVRSSADFAVAATGFVLLAVWRAPPLLVVAFSALAGMTMGASGRVL